MKGVRDPGSYGEGRQLPSRDLHSRCYALNRFPRLKNERRTNSSAAHLRRTRAARSQGSVRKASDRSSHDRTTQRGAGGACGNEEKAAEARAAFSSFPQAVFTTRFTDDPYVFPSARSASRPMSDNALLAAMRRCDIPKEEMTGHGFRATARTILDEVLNVRVDLIEHQLGHAVRDPNGRAYNRTSFLPDRFKMMQTWADYLDVLRTGVQAATSPPFREPDKQPAAPVHQQPELAAGSADLRGFRDCARGRIVNREWPKGLERNRGTSDRQRMGVRDPHW